MIDRKFNSALVFWIIFAAVLGSRLYLKFQTGGSGRLPLHLLLTLLFFLAAGFVNHWRAPYFFNNVRFIIGWLPWLMLGMFLPILGALVNDYPARTLMSSFSSLNAFCIIWLGFYFGISFTEEERRKMWSRGLLIAVTAQFSYTILQFLAKKSTVLARLYAPFQVWDMASQRVTDDFILARSIGFFENPNTLGFFSALFFLLCYYFIESKKQRYFLCVMCIITLIVSQSRGAMIALLILIALRLINDVIKGNIRSFIYTSIMTIFTVLIVYSLSAYLVDEQYYARISSFKDVIATGYRADPNLTGRVDFWKAAVDYWELHPFGSLGSPEYVLGTAIDNDWFRMLMQGGLLYVLSYFALIVSGVLLKSNSFEGKSLQSISLIIAISGMSQVPTSYPPMVVYWFILGISFTYYFSYYPIRIDGVHEK